MSKVSVEEVFRWGKTPTNPDLIHLIKHPKDHKRKVRCILQNQELFFNIGDFLKPFKAPVYQIAINVCLPSEHRNLSQIWMAKRAWEAISEKVKKKLSINQLKKEIKKGVTEGTLFPDLEDEEKE